MPVIDKSSYATMDKEILYEEYVRLKDTVSTYSNETPYYVYSLCRPNGEPFYIGKGKGTRAFDHLKNFINNKLANKELKTEFDGLDNEPPIMFIIKGNLSESDAFELEKQEISSHGRFFEGGQLSNIMPGGGVMNSATLNRIGGIIGGRVTKDNKLGIFSESYDRSAQSKSNWENGLLDHLDFHEYGKLGGSTAVEMQVGIHDPKYRDKRSEWAKIGAQALEDSGNRSGVCSKEWREANNYIPPVRVYCGYTKITDKMLETAKELGSKFWWNNGIINKKSFTQPEGFVRGQLMSEKKRASVLKNFGHSKGNNNE
jgi:hypothetical protein